MKTGFRSRMFKGGAYATTVSAVVIAIVVIVNLMFTKLAWTVDLTADNKFTLTEETITMLSELEDDITFYYLIQNGDSVGMFDNILSQYTKYGDTIKLVEKDPVSNPRFASKYTDESIEQYSIIVVNETNGRSRYVAYSDMLITEYGIDYETYQYYSEVTGLDMEGQLNSAIGYVTSDDLPTVYEVSGHGMQELGSGVVSMLEKANFRVMTGEDSLDLLATAEIPEDCDVLIITTPETDFTVDEVTVLKNYMDRGGKIIFSVSYLNAEHPNLAGFMADYGMEISDGLIFEGSSGNYMQAPYIILPDVAYHEVTNALSDSKYLITQYTTPIYLAEELPENITQTAILTTSASSYEKKVDAQSMYQEDGDASGSFNIGVHVEDTATGAEMTVYSCYYMFPDAYAGNSTFSNIDLLIDNINVLADAESNTITVRTIDLASDPMLVLTDAQINMWGLLTVILLPLGFLVFGIVRVVYRRKHA